MKFYYNAEEEKTWQRQRQISAGKEEGRKVDPQFQRFQLRVEKMVEKVQRRVDISMLGLYLLTIAAVKAVLRRSVIMFELAAVVAV